MITAVNDVDRHFRDQPPPLPNHQLTCIYVLERRERQSFQWGRLRGGNSKYDWHDLFFPPSTATLFPTDYYIYIFPGKANLPQVIQSGVGGDGGGGGGVGERDFFLPKLRHILREAPPPDRCDGCTRPALR